MDHSEVRDAVAGRGEEKKCATMRRHPKAGEAGVGVGMGDGSNWYVPWKVMTVRVFQR